MCATIGAVGVNDSAIGGEEVLFGGLSGALDGCGCNGARNASIQAIDFAGFHSFTLMLLYCKLRTCFSIHESSRC